MNKRWSYHSGKHTKYKRRLFTPFVIHKEDTTIEEKGGETMDRFWELLAKSTIFQGLITLLLLVTMCYLWATGKDVPDSLVQSSTLVLGFFFGAKVQQTVATHIQNKGG